MADVFRYLDMHKDLTFEKSPFNEVDGMIFSRFSYMPFEFIESLVSGHTISIFEAARQLLEIPDIKEKVLHKDDLQLISALSDNKRFGNMTLLSYENLTDLETQTQFSAITIQMTQDCYFVAFRGTDSSFIGWKEDFNMSFVCPVPAQEMAVRYLEKLAKSTGGRFIPGGHSKGGNLAVYAAAFCAPEIQNRINAVYNYDGPGFSESVLSSEGYRRICDKITTFIPQSSIVGLLLEHEEKYIIVHSRQTMNVMQHNVYTWKILQNCFEHLETVKNSSRFIDITLKSWVAAVNTEQREQFFDAIYTVLTKTNVQSFKELSENWFTNATTVIKSFKNLDAETKSAVVETLKALKTSTKISMTKIIKKTAT